MNIVPNLNIDSNLRFVQNGSLINAVNVMLNKDNSTITNENSLVVHSTITNFLKTIDANIVDFIPCNHELIIFLDNGNIVRYNETLNKCKVVINNYDYKGGNIEGSFSYNVDDELIIIFCQYDNIGNENTPLTTYNLKKFNDTTVDEELFKSSIIPEVVIPSIKFTDISDTWYKGWSFVFIRYKITDYNNYTQWYCTNANTLIDKSSKEDIQTKGGIKYTTEKINGVVQDTNIPIALDQIANVKANVSNKLDYSSISRNIQFINLDNRYSNYQIAIIVARKDTTKAFRTEDIDINIDNININTKTFNIEDSVNNIITTYNNYYNVKNIINFKDQIYISNYKEKKNSDFRQFVKDNVNVSIADGFSDVVIRNETEVFDKLNGRPLGDNVYETITYEYYLNPYYIKVYGTLDLYCQIDYIDGNDKPSKIVTRKIPQYYIAKFYREQYKLIDGVKTIQEKQTYYYYDAQRYIKKAIYVSWLFGNKVFDTTGRQINNVDIISQPIIYNMYNADKNTICNFIEGTNIHKDNLNIQIGIIGIKPIIGYKYLKDETGAFIYDVTNPDRPHKIIDFNSPVYGEMITETNIPRDNQLFTIPSSTIIFTDEAIGFKEGAVSNAFIYLGYMIFGDNRIANRTYIDNGDIASINGTDFDIYETLTKADAEHINNDMNMAFKKIWIKYGDKYYYFDADKIAFKISDLNTIETTNLGYVLNNETKEPITNKMYKGPIYAPISKDENNNFVAPLNAYPVFKNNNKFKQYIDDDLGWSVSFNETGYNDLTDEEKFIAPISGYFPDKSKYTINDYFTNGNYVIINNFPNRDDLGFGLNCIYIPKDQRPNYSNAQLAGFNGVPYEDCFIHLKHKVDNIYDFDYLTINGKVIDTNNTLFFSKISWLGQDGGLHIGADTISEFDCTDILISIPYNNVIHYKDDISNKIEKPEEEQDEPIDDIIKEYYNTKRQLIPFDVYNIYIHFVDKYGIASLGYYVTTLYNNFHDTYMTVIKNANNSSILTNSNGDNTNRELNIYSFLNVNIRTIPSGYVGWYLSYEKDTKNVCFVGAVSNIVLSATSEENKGEVKIIPRVASKFLSTSIDTNDKLDLGFNYIIYNDKVYTITNKEDIILTPANTSKNIGQWSSITLGDFDFTTNSICVLLKNINGDVTKNVNNKTLIPLTKVFYKTINKVLYKNDEVFYPGFKSKIDVFYNEAPFEAGSTGIIERFGIPDVNTEYKYGSAKFSINWIIDVPDEYKQINNEPNIIFYPPNPRVNKDHNGVNYFLIVNPSNTRDIFKQNHLSYEDAFPKTNTNYRTDIKYIYEHNNTIRRSNVLQDESFENSFRLFNTLEYYNIKENKGEIVSITNIGNIIIVHTKCSIFILNAESKLTDNNNNVINISNVDIFSIKYKELITSKLGHGGIQNKKSNIVGSYGYVWYNDDDKTIFRYDNNKLTNVDKFITNWIHNYDITNIRFYEDKDRNRLIVTGASSIENVILTYNYASNTFVSFHTYNISKGANTENNLYLFNGKTCFVFDNKTFGKQNNVNVKSAISIILNDNYNIIKGIEYLYYNVKAKHIINTDSVVSAVSNNGSLPVEGCDNLYAGNKLRVYNNFVNTDYIDLKVDKDKLNSVTEYNKPYRHLGNWNVNLLRDNNTDDDGFGSRIYGNYFIIDFVFDKPIDCDYFEINDVDCKVIAYDKQ